jgi:hypothetical protein
MSSGAVDRKLSTCCIDILRKKFIDLQKLVEKSFNLACLNFPLVHEYEKYVETKI